jgi:hypothetical protein
VKVERNETAVSISFGTTAGKTYRLESSLNLKPGDWETVAGSIVGTGGIVTITDPVAASTETSFYRIRLAP